MTRPRLRRASAVWTYLAGARRLPAKVLEAADAADILREGPYGSAWFAHRDAVGRLTGIEMRGPAWRTFSAGGDKTLFQFPGGNGPLPRMAVCESAIDACEHHVEDPLGMFVRLAFGPQRGLVGPHELGDRKLGLAPARQKLGP